MAKNQLPTYLKRLGLLLALAFCTFFWTTTTQSADAAAGFWSASYYNNRTLSGSPALIRSESMIQHNWGRSGPGFAIGSDNFSARWQRTDHFEVGRYRFSVSADDGVRVYVDNNLIIDHWVNSAASPLTAEVNLGAGHHVVRVEYYEATLDASISFNYERIHGANDGKWHASYWNNTNFSGTPVMQRTEHALNHNWGFGSPSSTVGNDFFSARWQTTVTVPSGDYRLDVSADDGIRVWVDNNQVIDQWHLANQGNYSVDMYLNQGTYTLRVEYFEQQGTASAALNFYAQNSDGGDDDSDKDDNQDPYPALTLPVALSGYLMSGGRCLNSNWYVGMLEDVCNQSGKWTLYQHADNRYLLQSAESGKCLTRTQYADGYQIRMHACDRNDSNQHFDYQLSGSTIRLWLTDDASRHLGIGGHGGNRAFLVNNPFSWTLSR